MTSLAELIARQRAYFDRKVARALDFRLAQLHKLHDALESREQVLFEALYGDLRKSPHDAYATEVGLVLSEIRHAVRHLRTWMKPQRRRSPLFMWPARGFVQAEPYGVALIMGPWNYPVQLLLAPLVGAIAAGNCVVLKPSEFAAQTAGAIAEMIGATFSEEYIAVVQGNREVAEGLLREKFDKVFFTGSSHVGRAVLSAAACHLTPVTLELGGKCPCIVCADAPLDITARRIAWGKFMNAGQTCVAPDFVAVDHRIAKPFLEAMQRVIKEFYGSNPRHSTSYGRIVNRGHFDRLVGLLACGRAVCGGERDAQDLYIAPTILTEVGIETPVMQEEIFGPILPVLEFVEIDQVLCLLRARPTPLALYVFTKDRVMEEHVLAQTRSGGVCINDTVSHMIGHGLPFGGLGESGMGAYHGKASFDVFSHCRSVLRRSFAFDPRMRYPPQRFGLRTLKRAYRFFLGR